MSIKTISEFYYVDGKLLSSQYKDHISDYREWDQLDHAGDYVLFKENMGSYLSIDESCLSRGELYTIVINKEAKGKKGALTAMIKGTLSEFITDKLHQIPRKLRLRVKEITLDLSPTMKLIAKQCFPNASIVSDRFHVQ